ncbi:MAG: tetratricopeptide repeat protein, partial [Dokdonella sp.]
ERDTAHRQEQQAQFERNRAQQVTDFLINLFQSADPAKAQGKDISARELLQKGAHQLETDLGQQPLMRAAMLAAIADIYIELDDLDLAELSADQASRLRHDVQPTDTGALAASLRQTARLAMLRGKAKQALARIDQAITLDAAADTRTKVAALAIRAQAMEGAGELKEAVTVWREALVLALADTDQDDKSRALRIAFNLARSLRALGNLPEAEHVIRTNLAASDAKFSDDAHAIRASLTLELAVIARNRGDLDEANTLAQQGYEGFKRTYGVESSQVATAANTLATISQARGDLAGARQLFQHSLAIKRKVYGSDNPRVASAEYNLGLLLLRLDDSFAAVPHLQRAVEIGSQTLPPSHSNLANYRLGYGSALRDRGRFKEARAELALALHTFKEIDAPQGIDVALSQGELACSTRPSGRHDTSELASLKQAAARLRKEAPDDPQSKRIFECLQRWQ